MRVLSRALALGKTCDPEWALRLATVPAPWQSISFGQDQHCQGAFCWPMNSFASHEARLQSLIQLAFGQLERLPEQDSVLLVTPEFGPYAQDRLADWLNDLATQYPGPFAKNRLRVFPYGSAGVPMAVAHAQDLLIADPLVRIWLIGVDSLAQHTVLEALSEKGRLSSETGSGLLPSEGAVILELCAGAAGLQLEWQETGGQSSDQQRAEQQRAAQQPEKLEDAAIRHLFERAAYKLKTPLDHLYLPDNGDKTLTQSWLQSYLALAPVLSGTTQMHQPGMFTGELGAAGGVYRVLHLYEAYRRRRIQGRVLQCEISASLYRAVASYGWQ